MLTAFVQKIHSKFCGPNKPCSFFRIMHWDAISFLSVISEKNKHIFDNKKLLYVIFSMSISTAIISQNYLKCFWNFLFCYCLLFSLRNFPVFVMFPHAVIYKEMVLVVKNLNEVTVAKVHL